MFGDGASTLTPQTLSNIGCMSAEGEKVRGDQLAEAEECWRMHAEPLQMCTVPCSGNLIYLEISIL